MKAKLYKLGGAMARAWALLAMAPGLLVAGDFQYEFNSVLSGTAPLPSNQPWLDAIFQSISPGVVQLTLTNVNLAGSENVESVYFNLNPALQASALKFNVTGETGLFQLPTIAANENKFKAASGGYFDIGIAFSNGGTDAQRFTAGDSLVLQISGIPTLTASDFLFLSTPTGSSGTAYAAARVQRIGTSSGWIVPQGGASVIPVPEPSLGALLSLGVGLWLVFVVSSPIRRALPKQRPARIRVAIPRRNPYRSKIRRMRRKWEAFE